LLAAQKEVSQPQQKRGLKKGRVEFDDVSNDGRSLEPTAMRALLGKKKLKMSTEVTGRREGRIEIAEGNANVNEKTSVVSLVPGLLEATSNTAQEAS